MFLRSLEVRGFKSFADKTELRFKKGVTAVVGPNGSGKSNISDSVRWVLGEQSVKNLRGGKMEDVIFSGTQYRKPLGLAQVSLTLDNSDGTLSTDYNEVIVTRRIFRSGETEYLINNQRCRLKDITELFMDTGIGKEGYSLIGQGKIDAILSGKAEERRALLEEAAGIVKFKARKEEAEKRLENTEGNLVRIRDIISTYEERLEPLAREKDKALKYKDLAEELKVKEVSLLVNHINKVKKDIEDLTNRIEYEEKKIDKKKCNLKELKDGLLSLETQIEELEKKNNDEKEEYYKNKDEVAFNLKEIELFNERKNNFKSLIDKEENEVKKLQEKINELVKEKEIFKLELENKIKDYKSKEIELLQVEINIKELTDSICILESELEGLKEAEFEFLSRNSEMKNSINSLTKELDSKNEQNNHLSLSLSNLESNLTINIGTVEELKNNILVVKGNIKKLEDDILYYKRKLAEKHDNLNTKEKELKLLSKKINESEATHTTLSNLEKHYEGYNRTVKTLMEHANTGRVKGISSIKVLGEIFNVEKEFEIAIEIALGAAISNIITRNEEDAKKLISYLKVKGMGRATFLPLNIIKGRKLQVSNEIKQIEGYIGIAPEILTFNQIYKDIVEYTLGRVIIAKDMDSALNISKVGKHSYKIVTLTGEVVNPGGALTGGSIQGKTINLLGRKREIEELGIAIVKYREDFKAQSNKIEEIKLEIKKIDEEILNKRDEIHQNNIDLTVINGEIKVLIGEGEKFKKQIESSKEELRINKLSIDNITKLLDSNRNELVKLNEKSFESKERVKVLEEEISTNKKQLDRVKDIATNTKISKATLEEAVQGHKNNLNFKLNEIQEKESKINELINEIGEKKDNILSLEEKISEKENIIKIINTRIKDLTEIFKEDEVRKVELKDKLKFKEGVISEVIDLIRAEENELNKKAIQNAKLESEQESLYSKLNGELNLTLAEAQEIAIELENIQVVKEAIGGLKAKIAALGTVNLKAIVEYDEVSEKYNFMFSQEQDLQKAKEELLRVIDEMTLNMQKLFEENFKILNENFGETFKELFKGGTAELILSGDDVLNSNIVINVQPPGKKLQNINLMSGGEKVLSAIALLFAILKMKPTPFCILDEIEAALDDANVYRYAEFLKKFSTNIQFIVITHRKGTMEASDVMYGVTMEEKGVSKVVSVDLTDS